MASSRRIELRQDACMDTLATVISVDALLVACGAAWYARAQTLEARRQAVASEETVRIERERRDEERADRASSDLAAATADVVVDVQRTFGIDSRPMLRLVNRGPHDAADVIVTFLDANDGLAAPDTSRWREFGGSDPLRSGAVRSLPWDPDYDTTSDFRAVVEWIDGRGPQRRELRVRA
jgi:hypothetical protein